MSTFIDIPLWEDAAPAPRPDNANMIRLPDGRVQCRDCSDIIDREGWFEMNHGIVFNGWCIAHLLCNHNANDRQREWLDAHGFVAVDAHDPTFWNLP